ncbi:putative ribonuclease H-like domain-containing protein [Tanacetum coccineum]
METYGKVFTKIGYNLRPTRRTFTLVRNACPLTRIAATNKVPLREPISLEVVSQESIVTNVYTRRPKVVQIVLWNLDSGCSKHMTGDRSQLTNFVHKFLGTVKFDNDQIAKIMGYGDYQIGNITILMVYYVEGLGHNLLSVGQLCDSDLEVQCKYHQKERMVYGNNYNMVNYNYTTKRTYPNAQRNMVPRVVLMKIGLKPFNTARTVNTAHPKSIVFSAKPMSCFPKIAQSTAQAINTARPQAVNTGRPKAVKTARPNSAVVNAVRVNQANVVKALACWVWRPTKPNSASITLNKHNYIDARGRSKQDLMEVMLHLEEELMVVEFLFPDENQILLRIPREDNMYSFDMKNIVPKENSLGKFDGKSDEGFFVGYSLSSKAFRVYNTRTRRVEENLHIGFLENKPMIEGNGPKWLFDIDSLTQSMNYVPVVAGTIINESVGTQGELNAGTSEEISQDCIVMPIWKDASYFDSPSKDVNIGEPKSAADDQKQVKDCLDNENDEKDKSDDDCSPKEVNSVGQHVNTASPDVNTGSFKLNTVDPLVNTASLYDQDSPKDMFTIGASHTLEATHVEFFSDEDELEVDLGNITNSYTVPTTSNTRIDKDHPIENVIGDVKLDPQALIKLYLIHLRWKQCRKNFCNSNSNRVKRQEKRYLTMKKFLHPWQEKRTNKSALLYGTIEEEVYVTQPSGFKDPNHPDKVYKVVKALYGLHQAPRAWYETLANYLLGNGLQEQQKEDGIFISQDKYVAEILKKFNYTDVKSVLTPVDLEKPLVKDGDANDVDYVHVPDFKDSPFELVAYTDSDYARATQDRKSTTEVSVLREQFLISWHARSKLWDLITKGFDARRFQYLVSTLFEGRPFICSQTCMEGYVISKAIHKELGDRMERAATTASSFEAEQDSGSGPRCQDTILVDADAQTRLEITSKQSNDLPLSRGYTLGSGEDSMELLELMEFWTILAIFPIFQKLREQLYIRFMCPVLTTCQKHSNTIPLSSPPCRPTLSLLLLPPWQSLASLFVKESRQKMKGFDHMTWTLLILDGYDDSWSPLTQQTHLQELSQRKHNS